MKHCYLSVVFRWSDRFTCADLQQLDRNLGWVADAHEIVIVVDPQSYASGSHPEIEKSGGYAAPVSIVVPRVGSSDNGALLAGLGRAVGDFVLEWDANIADLDRPLLAQMLGAADMGAEIVEIVPKDPTVMSRAFYQAANSLRPKSLPLRPSIGRLLSRRSLEMVLRCGVAEPNRVLLVADTALPRVSIERQTARELQRSYPQKVNEAASVLVRGTRFGAVAPLVLASAAMAVSMCAAIYALGWYVFAGKTPQGWTTLMMLAGIGFAVVLGFLGLIWVRLDHLYRILNRSVDETSVVVVLPPKVVSLIDHQVGLTVGDSLPTADTGR